MASKIISMIGKRFETLRTASYIMPKNTIILPPNFFLFSEINGNLQNLHQRFKYDN